MKKIILTILAFQCLLFTAIAQDQHLVDSLNAQLKIHYAKKAELGKNAPVFYDSSAAIILYHLSKTYLYVDPDKTLELINKSLDISGKIGYKLGQGKAYNVMGVVYSSIGDNDKAIEYLKNARVF